LAFPWPDALAVVVLVALAALLFRKHIAGETVLIGNPDRLCSHLKILKGHADGLARGHMDAWNDGEMMGYDSFTMPYTFPNPFTYLTSWLGAGRLCVTAGFVSAALLACAGVAAFLFLRVLTGARGPSLAAAVLYQFSALCVLKVSQNDMSFAVFIVLPLAALVLLRAGAASPATSFVQLAVLLFALLQFMFLQKAAYALILLSAYALYRTVRHRDWRPLAVFTFAFLAAVTAAFPRICGVGLAMTQYSRSRGGPPMSFEQVYQLQRIFPYQVLRWFDDSLFGRFPSESALAGNSINLTEGVLLYTSTFVPFVVLLGLIYRLRQFPHALGRRDFVFFLLFLTFAFSVVAIKPVHHILFVLFLRMDFTHARILCAGLLPLAALVALTLADLSPGPPDLPRRTRWLVVTAGSVLVAALVVLAVAGAGRHWAGRWRAVPRWDLLVSQRAVARVVASGVAVALLGLAARSLRDRRLAGSVCYGGLCLALPAQAFLDADFRVNGPQCLPPSPPFFCSNSCQAPPGQYAPPTAEEVSALAARLQTDKFRCVLLPDPTNPLGFARGQVPGFWKLRAIDGYYGLGVPARLAALPWPTASRGLREINFSADPVPWPLLGLLNVKYGIVADYALFANAPAPGRPVEPTIVPNPAPVVPRCFFTHSVQPASSPAEAAARLVEGGRLADVCQRSFVEGLPGPQSFDAEGYAFCSGGGDRLSVTVDRSDRDRFLVVNDLYFPGWRATVDASPTRIYPANCVMRGVVVPAGATTVEFHYVPFVRSPTAVPFYAGGVVLLLSGVFFLRRAATRTACPADGSRPFPHDPFPHHQQGDTDVQ
jgi:hypothetical protein